MHARRSYTLLFVFAPSSFNNIFGELNTSSNDFLYIKKYTAMSYISNCIKERRLGISTALDCTTCPGVEKMLTISTLRWISIIVLLCAEDHTLYSMKSSTYSAAQQTLLMFMVAASLYFLEYQMLSAHTHRSLQHSMSILEADEAVTYHAVRRLQQTSNSPILAKKWLPMFNETGGLVVFLHIAKTGGTSVRNDFEELPYVRVKRVMDDEQLIEISPMIDRYLSSNKKKDGKARVMLLEIHGGKGEPMSVFQLHSYLQSWRARAAAFNKKVFVFTLLREPTAFYVSYFNFFKNPGCKWRWCDRPLLATTEDNLVKSLVPNHQCQYLARKINKAENRAVPVTRAECESVYSLLKADADWIGTTESMQDTTLPLLAYMFSGEISTGRPFVVHNKQRSQRQLTTNSLSSDARRRIGESSVYDQYLYESAVRDYQLEIWENVPSLQVVGR